MEFWHSHVTVPFLSAENRPVLLDANGKFKYIFCLFFTFFLNLLFFSINTDNFVYYANNLLICIVRRWDQSVKDGSNLLCMPREDNENNNPTFCRFQKNA